MYKSDSLLGDIHRRRRKSKPSDNVHGEKDTSFVHSREHEDGDELYQCIERRKLLCKSLQNNHTANRATE